MAANLKFVTILVAKLAAGPGLTFANLNYAVSVSGNSLLPAGSPA